MRKILNIIEAAEYAHYMTWVETYYKTYNYDHPFHFDSDLGWAEDFRDFYEVVDFIDFYDVDYDYEFAEEHYHYFDCMIFIWEIDDEI